MAEQFRSKLVTAHVCIGEFDPQCPDCIRHDENCGTRCDTCSERMCEQFGPEPRPCSTTCADCRCDCTSCAEAAQDREDELRYEMARDERWAL